MSDQAAAFIDVFGYCDVSVAIVTRRPRAFQQATQAEQEELETEGAEGNDTTPPARRPPPPPPPRLVPAVSPHQSGKGRAAV